MKYIFRYVIYNEGVTIIVVVTFYRYNSNNIVLSMIDITFFGCEHKECNLPYNTVVIIRDREEGEHKLQPRRLPFLLSSTHHP